VSIKLVVLRLTSAICTNGALRPLLERRILISRAFVALLVHESAIELAD
jgi:hypothetical protein